MACPPALSPAGLQPAGAGRPATAFRPLGRPRRHTHEKKKAGPLPARSRPLPEQRQRTRRPWRRAYPRILVVASCGKQRPDPSRPLAVGAVRLSGYILALPATSIASPFAHSTTMSAHSSRSHSSTKLLADSRSASALASQTGCGTRDANVNSVSSPRAPRVAPITHTVYVGCCREFG